MLTAGHSQVPVSEIFWTRQEGAFPVIAAFSRALFQRSLEEQDLHRRARRLITFGLSGGQSLHSFSSWLRNGLGFSHSCSDLGRLAR
jgi:hypothetical protein